MSFRIVLSGFRYFQHAVLALATIMLLLAGAACANYADIQHGLRGLVGQDVQIALARLGPADQTIKRATHNIYIWESNRTTSLQDSFNERGPARAHGSDVADENIFGGGVALGCAIKLTTNPENIVKTWEFKRGLGRCSAFQGRL